MPPAPRSPQRSPERSRTGVLEREVGRASGPRRARVAVTFVICVGPRCQRVSRSMRAGGSALPSASTADLTLRLSPLDMPAFLADPTALGPLCQSRRRLRRWQQH